VPGNGGRPTQEETEGFAEKIAEIIKKKLS